MIARKIVYIGHFNQESLAVMYDITRKTEITGVVKAIGENQIELDLEGDASMIKLIQHQIERRVKSFIKDKTVTPIPYANFIGVTLLN